MRNSVFIFKSNNIYYILFACILSCFLSCNEDKNQSQKNNSIIPVVKELEASQAEVFLTYIDSVSKLSEAKFNEAGIRSLNKRFLSKLPLVMHDPTKEENGQNIIVQYYTNEEVNRTTDSEIIFLIPEAITDSLAVADFTDYFGHIKTEKPLIGVTAQPLPIHIRVSSDREIKLTFRNNGNQNLAAVTTIEVLNYR
ncbi:hypothetical protein A0O34_17620 [Chryseobacterium glaciei]|uniref:Uncharacterized protein n=1 Tax=Chryseobacterium glaciei TaxID=1685010 RepID=A0A172XZ46_9FLAO|nr:hypothetical protein [Chryseobacterium glaciei]ANF52224.1 hypothetical protein A0O34_17620 [Chryseobacterium glaciei]